MFSGDSLTVVLALGGAGLTCLVGALSASPGWRTTTLFGMAAIFAVVLAAWLFAPVASPVFEVIREFILAAVQSGVLVMLGTVAVVSMMYRRSSPAPFSPAHAEMCGTGKPKFCAPASEATKWTPDLSLKNAALYISSESKWSGPRRRISENELTSEIQGALYSGKLRAWSKTHPEDKEFYQIRSSYWHPSDIDINNSYAYLNRPKEAAYDVHVSSGELRIAYPPRG